MFHPKITFQVGCNQIPVMWMGLYTCQTNRRQEADKMICYDAIKLQELFNVIIKYLLIWRFRKFNIKIASPLLGYF